jgi:hypothetical protein
VADVEDDARVVFHRLVRIGFGEAGFLRELLGDAEMTSLSHSGGARPIGPG